MVEEIYLVGAEPLADREGTRRRHRGPSRRRRRPREDDCRAQGDESTRSRPTRRRSPTSRRRMRGTLRSQKPTEWTTLEVHRADSKQGPPATAKPGATSTINKDGSILASGKLESLDLYTVVGLAEIDKPITALQARTAFRPESPREGSGPRGQWQPRAERVPRRTPNRSTSRTRSPRQSSSRTRSRRSSRTGSRSTSPSTATARPAGRSRRNLAAIMPPCSSSRSR